jgi:hypothetical protein
MTTRRPDTQRVHSAAPAPIVVAGAKPLPAIPGLVVRSRAAGAAAAPGDKTVRPARPRPNTAATVGRHARRGGLGLMLVGAVLGLALAGLYVRLLFGPMSLDWLKGTIERAIERELPGLEVGIGSVILRRGEWGGAEFRLVNVKIKQTNGITVAEAPLAAIGLSGRGLLRATIAPASVEFISPKLQLAHTDAGGLSLRFQTTEPAPRLKTLTPPAVRVPPSASRLNLPPDGTDIIRAVADQIAAARLGGQTTSFLTTFGVRDAEIEIERKGRTTLWRMPAFAIDLAHLQKRSVISGEGTLITGAQPWTIAFRSVESAKAKTIAFAAEIRGLVPKALMETLPDLNLITGIQAPVTGRITVEMSTDGELKAAEADLSFGAGRIALPLVAEMPLHIDQGSLVFAFDPLARRFDVKRVVLQAGRNRLFATGSLTAATEKGKSPAVWRYQANLLEAIIEDLKLGPDGLPIDDWTMTGRLVPETGEIDIEEMGLKIAGVDLDLRGEATRLANRPAFVLDGRIGPLPGSVARRIVSRLNPELSVEMLERLIPRGEVAGGNLRLVLAAQESRPGPEATTAVLPAEVSLSFDMLNVDLVPIDGLPPVRFPSAKARYSGSRLEIVAPEARISLSSGRQVTVNSAELTFPDLAAASPMLEVAFHINGAAAAVLELIDQEPLRYAQNAGLDPTSVEGKVEAQFRLAMPVRSDVKLSDMRIEGKARLAEARVRGALGNIDLHGGTLALTLSERLIDAKGDILFNGVPAKISWQKRLDAGADEQPPLKITARLDNADRETLGFAVNHMVSGDVPVVITVKRDANGKTLTSVLADLGGAELILETLPWQKQPGRAASLRFDIARGKDGRTELQNFKITGEDIAIEGWVALDAKNQLKAFYFPEFTLNVITQMDVSGRMRDDGVLDVKVKSTSYDGRAFFRSLLTQPRVTDKSPLSAKSRSPLDLVAEIDTMVGFTDTNLKNVKVTMKRRGNRITALEATANFSTGGAPLAVTVRPASTGHRIMTTETTDAGSAFRLIGFYGSIRGGEANLSINLDGQGHADKTGILHVRRFVILGDQIVSEVLKPTESGKRIVREEFPFDRMRVPFQTGHGQIVLGESYLRGPIIGATLRGRIDYQTQTVNLGGTYVPLSGLQGAFQGLPVLGEIIGEGIFGITYAIEGPMAKPNVLVNPLSLVAPGILRGIFDMAPPAQAVQPRPDPKRQTAPSLSSSLPPVSTDEEAQRNAPEEPTPLSPQQQPTRRPEQPQKPKVDRFEPFKSESERN